jgi:hypothetical protein
VRFLNLAQEKQIGTSETIAPPLAIDYIARMSAIDIPLSSWRRRLGLTQAEAGRALEISRRIVQYYESGEWPIPRTVTYAMAYLLEHPEEIDLTSLARPISNT